METILYKTELQSVIAGIEWNEGADFGVGVNAIDGSIMAKSILPFGVTKPGSIDTRESYTSIESEEDFEQMIDTKNNVEGTIAGVNIKAGAEYTKKVKFSKHSLTIIAEYKMRQNAYAQEKDNNYALNDRAAALLNESPDKFRKTYGDYFVAGIKSESSFIAMYACTSNTKSELNRFKASAGVSNPGMLKADSANEFETSLKSNNIRMEIHVFMNGVDAERCPCSAPWTAEKVIKALQWFKEHQSPRPTFMKLQHYNTIDPSFSRESDIEPAIFIRLKKLFRKQQILDREFNSFPILYTNPYSSFFQDFINGTNANKANMVQDPALLRHYEQMADEMADKLKPIQDRYDFFLEHKDNMSEIDNKHQSAEKGKGVWGPWGITAASNPNVGMRVHRDQFRKDSAFAKKQKHEFTSPSGEWLITGWKVISNWTDGSNGGWEKKGGQVIGSSDYRIFVESQTTRGCHWTVEIYYVNKNDYKFE
ncbi:hypothetical protein [Niabella drilacis]|uniref:Uncharacterized protein n=1 Tax=Niabella drilacis (strain DSM 25811 / CCM 8410 / CCUG 62505 / LMG 26954 / E90) TaxID=1285928 RepID=A0A1G6SXP1_NIADE|nr:hypothetical protein [Niabella drilacis]SDD21511.1 hypothetical protein SAMN04487894_1079 [Niabella drilacis]